VRSWRNELKRAWTIGIQGPNLALGWGLAVLLFTGLRLLGQVPGWRVAGGVLILLTLIVGAWQLTQLALTLIGRRPAAWQSWQLVWRNKGTWLLVALGLIILMLPLGLWGLQPSAGPVAGTRHVGQRRRVTSAAGGYRGRHCLRAGGELLSPVGTAPLPAVDAADCPARNLAADGERVTGYRWADTDLADLGRVVRWFKLVVGAAVRCRECAVLSLGLAGRDFARAVSS